MRWRCSECQNDVVTASMNDPCPECHTDYPKGGIAAPAPMTATEVLLVQRGEKYGDVDAQAKTFDDIMKAIAPPGSNWSTLAPRQRQSLNVIALKISRIMHGDPDYDDNWDDIAGYALLGKKRHGPA